MKYFVLVIKLVVGVQFVNSERLLITAVYFFGQTNVVHVPYTFVFEEFLFVNN